MKFERPDCTCPICIGQILVNSSVDDYIALARVGESQWGCGIDADSATYRISWDSESFIPDSWWSSIIEKEALDASCPAGVTSAKRRGGL
jgi:hypothetical protein